MWVAEEISAWRTLLLRLLSDYLSSVAGCLTSQLTYVFSFVVRVLIPSHSFLFSRYLHRLTARSFWLCNMDGVKTLSDMIIPTLPTFLLLQFLQSIPNSTSTVDALEELATREFSPVLTYWLSLPFSHSHRPVLKSSLESRLHKLSVDDLKSLSGFLLQLSALQYS